MRIPTALLTSTLVAAGLAAAAPKADAVPCFTRDTVAVARNGVSANGYVDWNNDQSGYVNVVVRDVRDGRAGRFFIQYNKSGVGWIDRVQYNVADGGSITVRGAFSRPYHLAAIGLGVARENDRYIDIAWDNNRPCGA